MCIRDVYDLRDQGGVPKRVPKPTKWNAELAKNGHFAKNAFQLSTFGTQFGTNRPRDPDLPAHPSVTVNASVIGGLRT